MRFLTPLALCLTACSSDPSPTPGPDAQVADAADVASELASDVAADAAGDTGPAVDVLDAAVDAPPDVTLGAVADVAPDVHDAAVGDVAADGDGGGGVVTYDLGRMYGTLEAHATMHRTTPPMPYDERDCPDTVTRPTCSFVGSTIRFDVQACYGVGLTGLLYLGDAGAPTVSISGGGMGSFARTLRFDVGPSTAGRRNLHVQLAAPPFQGEYGISGIPGRSVDPDLGDLWLLGCTSS